MVSYLKQLCAAIGIGLLTLAAHAQVIQPGFRAPGPIGLNQAAFNLAMSGQVHPGFSPVISYPFGNPLYNRAVNPIINPYANPALNPAINPAALANYYSPALAFQSSLNNPFTNPYTNPYVGASLTAGSPYAGVAGPYAGYANPYAGYANPYTAATLSSTGYGAYGGYGGGGYDISGGYGGSYYGESPVGGYMRGTADIVGAQGRWMKDLQQASLTKEQVRQSKIDTRRKWFEEWLYERKNTPTFEDERQFFANQQLLRSLNNPPEGEIWSGQALNDILADVSKMDKSARGPAFPLDEDVLRHLNLTAGPGAGNAGLLKNDARLSWPLALRDEPYKTDRELVNSLAPEAVRQAVNGRVDAGTLRELTNAAQRLRENLATNIKDMTANQYTEASRFLGFLEDAIRVLGRPDAGDFFTRKYAAQGKDIGELVRNLTSKGLRFAAATPGDEPAYLAVHRALTVYDRGAKAEVASEGRAGDSKP
jgi:hypothetical protein